MTALVPSSLLAEKALLGALLTNPDLMKTLVEMELHSDHFYSAVHQIIYQGAVDLYEANQFVDYTTLLDFLEKNGQLDQVGGLEYIAELTLNSGSRNSAGQYAKDILDKAQLRRLMDEARDIRDLALTNQSLGQILEQAESKILDVTRFRATTDFVTSKEVAGKVLAEIKDRASGKSDGQGLITGYREFDKLTQGFQKGDLILLAARPSVGKTALALNLALECATRNKAKVAIFSLEMPAEQLITRMMSARSMVEADKLKTGQKLSQKDWNGLNEAANVLMHLDISIDDSSMTRMSDIFSKCRKLQTDEGLDFVVIDYIQLINSSSTFESRQQEVSLISRNLKMLARELNVPVLALSQLSRSVEQRSDKRPMLSDLRESGSLEQDADLVMMLYREDYYKEINERSANQGSEVIEINLAKHRNGPVGQVKLSFEPNINKFINLTFMPDPS